MSPQVLVHTLIVWVFKLLFVHHHFGGVWEREAAHNSLEERRQRELGEREEREERKREEREERKRRERRGKEREKEREEEELKEERKDEGPGKVYLGKIDGGEG